MSHPDTPTSPTADAPAPIALASTVVGALVAKDFIATGRERGGARGRALIAAGAALAIGAAADLARRALMRAGVPMHVIRLDETLVIDRPVTQVFAFCRDFENFPRVFTALRCVEDFGNGRSHWEALSPTGRVLRWDAVVDKYMPNAVLGWRTVPGGDAELSGTLRFAPDGSGGTRLTVQLRFLPHAVFVGEVLRTLFHRRPESEVRDELGRLHAMIPPTLGLTA